MSELDLSKKKKEKDVFRETPVRLLGYTNEVGESFRSVVHVRWVWLSYCVASAYVIADGASKTIAVRKNKFLTEKERNVRSLKESIDVLTWQFLASVIIPGLTINRICAGANYLLKKTSFKNQKWITVAIGLSSIPFIVKPIDYFVDYALDNSLRPSLGIKKSNEED